MECEKCKALTDYYLKENPDKNGIAICEFDVKEMEAQGFVFMEFLYDPETKSMKNDGTIIYL